MSEEWELRQETGDVKGVMKGSNGGERGAVGRHAEIETEWERSLERPLWRRKTPNRSIGDILGRTRLEKLLLIMRPSWPQVELQHFSHEEQHPNCISTCSIGLIIRVHGWYRSRSIIHISII